MAAEEDKKLRPRSPEFPFLPLSEAVEKVKLMLAANQRHPVRLSAVAATWNTSAVSSGFLRSIAALKSFGLVEDSGSGDNRKVAVSELGARISTDARPGAREAAIKRAFESCTILNEFYQTWGSARPADHAALSELTLDFKFGEDAAKKFIKVYDASVAFLETNPATPKPEAKDAEPAKDPPPRTPAASPPLGAPANPVVVAPKKGGNMIEATYPISEGNCSLSYPGDMSQKSAQRLAKWLMLMLEDVREIATHPQDIPPDAED